MVHNHRWRIVSSLPMTLPDLNGYVQVLLIHACTCGAAVFHGKEREGRWEDNRILEAEAWTATGPPRPVDLRTWQQKQRR